MSKKIEEQVIEEQVIEEQFEDDIQMEVPEEEPKKKWYQTKWFKIAGGVIGLGAIYALGVKNGRSVEPTANGAEYSETPTEYIDVISEEPEKTETNE